MVIKLFFIGILLFSSTLTFAITADEVREYQRQAYEKEQARINRLDEKDLQDMAGKPTDEPKSDSKHSEKSHARDNSTATTHDAATTNNNEHKSVVITNKHGIQNSTTTNSDMITPYVPANNKNTDVTNAFSGSVKFDQVQVLRREYGIPLGTVIEGEITRDFSSADPSMVEIRITAPVVGNKRTLPAGSLVYANMTVNPSTKRIEIYAMRGITPKPESREFEILGHIFDDTNKSGVAGLVVENTKDVLQSGVNESLISAGKSGLRALTSGSIIGSAVSEGAGSILSDTKQKLDSEVNTNIIIYASVQPITIKIEKSF